MLFQSVVRALAISAEPLRSDEVYECSSCMPGDVVPLTHRRKGVGSLFMTRVSGIETRAVCLAAPALQLEILRIMS